MKKNTHYFIAIPLPSEIKQYYSLWQTDLKRLAPYKQWTHPSDFHITLKFLGNMNDNQLKELDHKLQYISTLQPFTMQIGKLGSFGNQTSPRVLWLGVEHHRNLLNLQKQVEKLAEKIGFPKEKRQYNPHITLAKKWKDPSISLPMEPLKQRYQGQYKELFVNQVVIYQINPKQSPKYKCIRTYPLRGE
ncbi:RNA 2',3'-cyclic phosphodiesterase [Cerasibacillus terrae]|uniref:RNA 2',3'-cyclic phosphodiesterase n=1 Tax=Cerasibacillus terrae TaxID=2498845 RepID=A0A5C8NJG5_9BACI|nr:RNA 2',3'-cyclic phosphodiesterase [Cerasibacillus terrae]TXL60573.1 RNA 2',3'-cyclic phosphodiesterase [Cerasibacillus terrae]